MHKQPPAPPEDLILTIFEELGTTTQAEAFVLLLERTTEAVKALVAGLSTPPAQHRAEAREQALDCQDALRDLQALGLAMSHIAGSELAGLAPILERLEHSIH